MELHLTDKTNIPLRSRNRNQRQSIKVKSTWQQVTVAQQFVAQFGVSPVELFHVAGQFHVVHYDLTALHLRGAQDTHASLPWVRFAELLQHILNNFVVNLLRVCNEKADKAATRLAPTRVP